MSQLVLYALLLAIFIADAYGLDTDLQCHVKGGCFEGVILDFKAKDTEADCQKFCGETDQCRWYTFNRNSSLCGAFKTCPNLISNNCDSCVSGQVDCEQPESCLTLGRAKGELIKFFKTDSVSECQRNCKVLYTCKWFTYSDGLCSLLKNVISVDESCKNCVYGSKNCQKGGTGSSCPLGWANYKNESCVYLSKDRKIVKEAKTSCDKEYGATLADVKTEDKNSFLLELMDRNHVDEAYVGGEDKRQNNRWAWPDGKRFNFTNWAQDEPQNGLNYNYLLITTDAEWFSVGGLVKEHYICQKDSIKSNS